MSSSVLKILIVIGLAVAIINDVGVIATGYYMVDDKAHHVADAAISDYRVNQNDTSAVAAAEESAKREDVTLTGFQVTAEAIRISIVVPPRKTWIASHISSLQPYISAQALVEVPIK